MAYLASQEMDSMKTKIKLKYSWLSVRKCNVITEELMGAPGLEH